MDWGTFFTTINTADTILGLLFLATSWIVARRTWLRKNHAQEGRGDVGEARPAQEEAHEDQR